MVFSTPLFLYFFLPICIFFYYLTPTKWRNLTLMCSSLLFYYWGEQKFVLIMFASIFIDFFHGLAVEHFKNKGDDFKARCAVASSIVFNLCLLGYFKYWNFFAESFQSMGLDFMKILEVHLPIGISFYTFQTMSYTIDVYRGDTKAQRNIINFGTFVTLFPQLIAGPILKYKELGDQVNKREHTIEKFASGIEIFIIGLCKKVIIANSMGQLWELFRDTPTNELTVLGAWLGVIACTFQIYFDFSGYSDMAVGLGRMLGFQFNGNFNYPYTAHSITDFWRRWHISLSSWFREYLYIPLGGNRKSKGRVIFNLFIVWAATGFWHGASWNFVLWGLYFFLLLVIEREFLKGFLDKLPYGVGVCYALFFVLPSWAIFFLEDLTHLQSYLEVMYGFSGVAFANQFSLYHALYSLPILLIAAVGSTPYPKKIYAQFSAPVQQIAGIVLMMAGLLVSTAYLVDATYNPFLYFRF